MKVPVSFVVPVGNPSAACTPLTPPAHRPHPGQEGSHTEGSPPEEAKHSSLSLGEKQSLQQFVLGGAALDPGAQEVPGSPEGTAEEAQWGLPRKSQETVTFGAGEIAQRYKCKVLSSILGSEKKKKKDIHHWLHGLSYLGVPMYSAQFDPGELAPNITAFFLNAGVLGEVTMGPQGWHCGDWAVGCQGKESRGRGRGWEGSVKRVDAAYPHGRSGLWAGAHAGAGQGALVQELGEPPGWGCGREQSQRRWWQPGGPCHHRH